MNEESEQSVDGEIFPFADVEASVANRQLQLENPIDEVPPEQRENLEMMRREAVARGASEHAEWIYFCSPEWTWRELCGREGWLLFDRERLTQHAFSMTVMN